MTSTISAASTQWATRPADERFTSLTALDAFLSDQRDNSRATTKSNRRLEFQPVDSDPALRSLNVQIQGMTSTRGEPLVVDPTHWAFSQAANLAGAPAGYLRTLPAPLACDALNWGLRHARDVEDVGLLVRRSPAPGNLLDDPSVNPSMAYTLAAVTGPKYGRIWNSEISRSLVSKFGDGVTGDWRVPGEFGKRLEEVTKANTTLYASDRDMFVFLADETNRITLPNRRNGSSGSLARGFYLWNSEVGSQSMGAAFFLFDYACKNRTIWGVEEFKEVRLRHTSGAPDRWLEQVTPVLEDYSNAAAAPIVNHLKAAQDKKIDDARAFLANRKFTKTVISGAIAAHQADEDRPMESLWDVSVGITAFARSIPYQDERVALERAAGAVLALAG